MMAQKDWDVSVAEFLPGFQALTARGFFDAFAGLAVRGHLKVEQLEADASLLAELPAPFGIVISVLATQAMMTVDGEDVWSGGVQAEEQGSTVSAAAESADDLLWDAVGGQKFCDYIGQWHGRSTLGKKAWMMRFEETQPAIEPALAEWARLLCLRLRRDAAGALGGAYVSRYQGSGLEFADCREYQDGDDARQICWPASLRTGQLLLTRYQEEREVNVILGVDVSRSMRLEKAKIQRTAEIAGLLAYCAAWGNDPMELVLFSDRLEGQLPPRRGERQAQQVIRGILGASPQSPATDLAGLVRLLAGDVRRRRSHIIIISDLADRHYGDGLTALAGRHDVLVCHLGLVPEADLPTAGWLEVEDAETGVRRLVNCAAWREGQGRLAEEHQRLAARLTIQAGAGYVFFPPGASPAVILQRYFAGARA